MLSSASTILLIFIKILKIIKFNMEFKNNMSQLDIDETKETLESKLLFNF
jgi:hypothetical protein